MKKSLVPILISLGGIFTTLLTLVDLRRGFLFPDDAYLVRNAFFNVSPFQFFLLLAGLGVLALTRRHMKALDRKDIKILMGGIFFVILIDFLLYRGIAMGRTLTKGSVGLDWLTAFGQEGILKSFYLSVSYLLTVWHATLLSCLLGGLSLLAMPFFMQGLRGASFRRAGLTGTLLSLTQPLCSCCIAVTAPSLFSRSLPKSFGISILLGAPLLNLSTLILAGYLLPWPYAILRILGGLGLTIVLGIVIAKFLGEENEKECPVPFTPIPSEDLVTNWFRLSGKLALWLFPSIIMGVMLTSFLWQFWPQNFSNSPASVAFVSFFGTFLMISTWSEIPLALNLIQGGFSGPAAAALIALPAVNLASLLLIGKSTRHWRLVTLMGLSIMALSFVTGMTFL